MRKKSKVSNCLFCNKNFNHYSWDKQKYCSKECFYKKTKLLRPLSNCNVCNKEFRYSYTQKKRNIFNYCSRECYNNRRKEDLKKVKRHTNYFIELVQNGCSCGIKDYYLLQIHHKDGNTNNNDRLNHEVVCANCHIKRHLKLNKKGKLVYHTKTLTSPEIFILL